MSGYEAIGAAARVSAPAVLAVCQRSIGLLNLDTAISQYSTIQQYIREEGCRHAPGQCPYSERTLGHHRPRGGDQGCVSRAEFVLRSSEAAAIEVLNERPIIVLDDEARDDFVAALDAPVELDPAVKAHYAPRASSSSARSRAAGPISSSTPPTSR